MLQAAKKLADILRSKKAYTNTSTFDLKCEVSLLSLYTTSFDSLIDCRNAGRDLKARKAHGLMLSRQGTSGLGNTKRLD